MLGYIFISKQFFRIYLVRLLVIVFATSPLTFAQSGIDEIPDPESFEGDQRTETPYTNYGEFNETEEEAKITEFFQYGRFFGVSAGAGIQGANGNRGKLLQGGFPLVDVKVHYWFDFNFALQLGFNSSTFFFEEGSAQTIDVSILYLGIDLKYYFDTRDLSAPITFAHPYILVGAGNFTKSEAAFLDAQADQLDQFGFGIGAGLEFLISPKQSYFYVEGKYQIIPFRDRFSPPDGSTLEDLQGDFFTFAGGVLFTW